MLSEKASDVIIEDATIATAGPAVA